MKIVRLSVNVKSGDILEEKLTLIHNYYIEDLFKEFNKEFCIIYGHRLKKKLGKKYFYLKQGYIKYLINVDYFISNNICDVLIKKAKKIYMHHCRFHFHQRL